MPLLGKIVVIKRNGGDGTEFPLTASCLFGRKLDCDIRIQLPQVSKEHCKIELNENKELILTNLSSVNPTRINGQVLDQSERLKHGDLITIIDRSFRFEYPPPKTPKKRLSGKGKTVQALQEQQGKSTPVPVEKWKSENSFDTCLKDGSNLPPAVEQTAEAEPEDAKLKKDSMSPFCELYQMVKQDLVAKSPWKSELPKTPLARSHHCEEVPTADAKNTPKQLTTPSTKTRRSSKSSSEDATKSTTTQSSCNAKLEDVSTADVKSTPKRVTTPSTKKRRSSKYSSEDITEPATPRSSVRADLDEKPANDMKSVGSSTPSLTEKSTTPVSQKRTPMKTPQKFSAGEVVQQILLEPQPEKTPKSPKRRSGESQNQNQPQTPGTNGKSDDVKMSPRTSPRSNAGKRFQVQDVLAMTSASKTNADILINEQLDGVESHTEVAVTKPKRKRVSFGGQLSPELFDKRLPPNSPLRRGATPRHSLGPSQKSQSLLRRASTIGLLALRLEETVKEAQKSSKKASPKRTAAKTPSPAKRTPITKAKTPSPKRQKSPSAAAKASTPSTPATPRTPGSARRASTSAVEQTETPRVQGRFSVSRISTPSPVQGEEAEVQSTIVEGVPQKYETPKIPLKRKSMKSSGRKTPKSAVKSALDVMRSRRSGASRANLKVLTSWADIVKFGQTKPQSEVATKKKTTKKSVVKKTVAPKPMTPVRRLKDEISTGHAASPVTIVVGKAHMRTNQFVGAAPKVVSNMAVCKKDMRMDEDFTGVADIFKTPANSKSKSIVLMTNECPEVLPDEISVMKTPEESGEMIVSPLSVVSTAKGGRYNNEAVTRLLLDNQDGSLLEDESLVQLANNPNEASDKDIISDQEMPSLDQTDEEEPTPEMVVETPKQKAAPFSCLTGVKRLMKTPKQRAEPIEDLRGKLLMTPKECKLSQEESLEGIKQLLKTPKQKSNPVLCAAGLKRLLKTPQEKSEHQEDLTGVKELMKTPKLKGELVENKFGLKRLVKTPRQKKIQVEEDLTGVQQLMKTPKHKGEPAKDQMGEKRLMQTPKEKAEHVEDLTGVKQLMQTPKQNGEPVSSPFGTSKLMKTPQVKEAMTDDDITDPKMLKEPENSILTTENVTAVNEILEPVPVVDSGSALIPAEDFNKECDKENICPVETMEIEVLKSVDHKCTDEAVDFNHSDPEIEDKITEEKHLVQTNEKSASVKVLDDCSFLKDEKAKAQSEEVCTLDDTNTAVEANPTLSTDKENICPVETMEIEVLKSVDHKCTDEAVDFNHSDPELEDKITEETHTVQTNEKSASVEVIGDSSSLIDEKTKEQSEEVCTFDNTSTTVEANPEQEDEAPIKSSLSNKSQRGSRGRVAQKSKNELAKVPAVLSLIQEDKMTDQQHLSPARGRRGRKALDVSEVAASPVRKSARGRILKHSIEDEQTKSTEACEVPEDSLKKEISDCLPVVTKTRKGRKAKQDDAGDSHCSGAPTTEEPVQAPVVKPGRRKMDKMESKPSADDEAPIEPILDVNAGVPQDPAGSPVEEVVQAPAVKPGRRKKMDKTKSMPSADHAAVEPIPDVNASVPQVPDGSAAEEVVQATTVKPGRRKKMDKTERQPSAELEENTPEIVCEGNAVAPEVAMCQTSQGTETVSATRARRGRPAKKENPKTEPAQILESEISATPAVVVDEKPVTSAAKSGRGRKAKQETVKDQPLDGDVMVDVQTVAKANVDHEEPVSPVVKSGRGRKAKQQKAHLAEEVVDQPAVDASLHIPVEKEQTKILLKSVRGGRKTKQAKVAVSVEAEENHEQTETPLKSGRKRTVSAKVTKTDAEVPVKRGRRAVADPPVAVLPSRGRKAVVKAQSEVTEALASSEEPVKAVKNTRRTAKEPESKKEESPVTHTDSEIVAGQSTAVLTLDKVKRGSRGKKMKDSSKDSPVNASEEASETKPTKTVNWNPDLVASKDIEEFEPAADVSKPQQKKSRRLGKSSAETSSTESTDLAPRGRRGRGAAKKEEEHPVEDSQEEAEMKVKTMRRGKAVASAASKSEPSESKAPTPLKRKRNEVLEVTDESVTKEPLPKRRGRVASTADVAKEVSSKEKTPEAEQEKSEANPKTNTRTPRGQKKTAQQPDPVPSQTQQPVSGTGTRKGRGVKKVEEVVIATEAVPVRRTRRK